jgi:hypothetical protein
MSTRRTDRVDLVRLFNTVTTTLKENQQSLNAADEYNHNHGDNMVQNFQVITRAMRAKKDAPPADQLAYASQALSQRAQSGSARLYAQGLAQAAGRFEGKPAVTAEDAMLLVQTLLGGQAAPAQSYPGGMDGLGSLLGGQAAPQAGQASGGDLMGSLLGALMGGAPAGQPTQAGAAQDEGGINLNTLLTAGMAFFQARQQGAEPLAALTQAVMAGSQMQGTAHHAQSGQLVAETLINTIGKMLARRRTR